MPLKNSKSRTLLGFPCITFDKNSTNNDDDSSEDNLKRTEEKMTITDRQDASSEYVDHREDPSTSKTEHETSKTEPNGAQASCEIEYPVPSFTLWKSKQAMRMGPGSDLEFSDHSSAFDVSNAEVPTDSDYNNAAVAFVPQGLIRICVNRITANCDPVDNVPYDIGYKRNPPAGCQTKAPPSSPDPEYRPPAPRRGRRHRHVKSALTTIRGKRAAAPKVIVEDSREHYLAFREAILFGPRDEDMEFLIKQPQTGTDSGSSTDAEVIPRPRPGYLKSRTRPRPGKTLKPKVKPTQIQSTSSLRLDQLWANTSSASEIVSLDNDTHNLNYSADDEAEATGSENEDSTPNCK